MPIQRVTHIALCVSEIERSRSFYRDALGFAECSQLTLEGSPVSTLMGLDGILLHAVWLERDGLRIELMQFERPGHQGSSDPRPLNQLGLTHFGVRVSDLESAIERAVEAGGQLVSDSRMVNEVWQSECCFVTDPDGTRVEFIQMPGEPSALIGDPI